MSDYASAKSAHRTFGAAPYGHDSNLWPQVWADAITILQSAENEADRIEMGQP